MTEINSAAFILMAEALTVVIILTVAFFAINRNKQGKEIAEIDQFIKRLAEDEEIKAQLLATILLDECGIETEKASAVLKQVSGAEKVLLRRIIEMFLQRNPSLLPNIEQLIANLSDPYFRLLADIRQVQTDQAPPLTSDDNTLNLKVVAIEHVNQQLVKQLDTAMQTINEMTAEYTRVFSGHQSALELENSGKRMLQIFQDAELRILHAHPSHKE